MQLRPYQRAAVDATWNFLRQRTANPCIVLPTGAGKTIVLAELIREALTSWPGTRICVLAHVRELVAQNADKLQRYWPGMLPQRRRHVYVPALRRRSELCRPGGRHAAQPREGVGALLVVAQMVAVQVR